MSLTKTISSISESNKALFTTLSRSYNKYSYLIGYFFILILVFIASLRYKTGTDYESYSSIWRSVLPLNKAIEEGHFGADYLEFGFLLFTSFIKIFSENSLIFFTSMSFLTLVILYKGLHKLSNINIYIAITLYFMMFYMGYVFNGMRQAVSMSLLIYSLTYIINGNLKKTFIITAIATSFHSTGFLIIISYFLTRININIILYFLIGLVLSIIFYYFNFLGSIIDLLVGGKFSHYIEFWGDTSLFQMTTRILLAIFFMFISIKVIKTNFFINITNLFTWFFYIYCFVGCKYDGNKI